MKYGMFAEDGALFGLYDSDFNRSIPEGAVPVSDEVFYRAGDEQDGIWKRINGEVVKTPFPPLPASVRITLAHDRINAAYEASVNILTAGYPATEIASWPKQEEEARRFLADETAITPWLSGAATARSLNKTQLSLLILMNANALASLHGALTGKRQRLRDRIDALGENPAQEQLDAIQW